MYFLEEQVTDSKSSKFSLEPVYNLVNQKGINMKPTPQKKYVLTETKLKKWLGMGGKNLPVSTRTLGSKKMKY